MFPIKEAKLLRLLYMQSFMCLSANIAHITKFFSDCQSQYNFCFMLLECDH